MDLHEHAGHCDDDAMVGLATDDENTLLITADGGGTVKVPRSALDCFGLLRIASDC